MPKACSAHSPEKGAAKPCSCSETPRRCTTPAHWDRFVGRQARCMMHVEEIPLLWESHTTAFKWEMRGTSSKSAEEKCSAPRAPPLSHFLCRHLSCPCRSCMSPVNHIRGRTDLQVGRRAGIMLAIVAMDQRVRLWGAGSFFSPCARLVSCNWIVRLAVTVVQLPNTVCCMFVVPPAVRNPFLGSCSRHSWRMRRIDFAAAFAEIQVVAQYSDQSYK